MPFIRQGYRLAIARWNDVMKDLPPDLTVEASGMVDPRESPTALTLIATHDVLEWIHSMDDYLKERGTYKGARDAAEVDPELGPYIDGMLGARAAIHHLFTPVVGLARTTGPRYLAVRDRWELIGTTSELRKLHPRWVSDIPKIRNKRQRDAFLSHLAGRAVGNTFQMATHYFWTQMGTPPAEPFVASGPADHPPPIVPFSDDGSDD
ncbi:hypothetical protein [Microbacterium sp. SSM24]|uniref:hypothetical protein n=1 Tax=Microbacterium sp. SSM24 TaxID=2991714 RepID=UPI0022265D5A|nr:hypothetical protein [Microbacterium sp. SSM24]MCW3494552.1 hypothetical protein [Microbacterium sp. SSM24]